MMDNVAHQLMDIVRFTVHFMADWLFKLMPAGLIGAMKAVGILLVVGIVIGFLDQLTEKRRSDPQAGS